MNRIFSEKCFSSFPLLFDGLRKTKNLYLEISYTNKLIFCDTNVLQCISKCFLIQFITKIINFFQTATESIL